MPKSPARKIYKRVRKGAARVVRSEFVRDVLEDLVKAALLAAAAKIADSKPAKKAGKAAACKLKKPAGARRAPSGSSSRR
jgi:hypothetical protein